MKKLGIIGGFGPETSAAFQMAIIKRCQEAGLERRPEIIMWNAPIPLHLEEDLILRDTRIHEFIPFLIQGARTLEAAGAEIIVMPCNTLHQFIHLIRKAVRVPVMSIIDETIEHLKQQRVTRVAIFATQATIESALYDGSLSRQDLHPILPTYHEQAAINQVIFDILNGKAHKRATRILKAISDECISRGATDILLACTDLQIVFPKSMMVRIHDTMHILAETTVDEMLE
ncbi:MAG TPA: amino acid racemase [Patescibacteria group bacterium]|nr:amino acid racemase [Patescibacteria group bacterium]